MFNETMFTQITFSFDTLSKLTSSTARLRMSNLATLIKMVVGTDTPMDLEI